MPKVFMLGESDEKTHWHRQMHDAFCEAQMVEVTKAVPKAVAALESIAQSHAVKFLPRIAFEVNPALSSGGQDADALPFDRTGEVAPAMYLQLA